MKSAAEFQTEYAAEREARLAAYWWSVEQTREARIEQQRRTLAESPIKVGDRVKRKSGGAAGTVRQLSFDHKGRLKARVHWHNGARWIGNREDGTTSSVLVSALVVAS